MNSMPIYCQKCLEIKNQSCKCEKVIYDLEAYNFHQQLKLKEKFEDHEISYLEDYVF